MSLDLQHFHCRLSNTGQKHWQAVFLTPGKRQAQCLGMSNLQSCELHRAYDKIVHLTPSLCLNVHGCSIFHAEACSRAWALQVPCSVLQGSLWHMASVQQVSGYCKQAIASLKSQPHGWRQQHGFHCWVRESGPATVQPGESCLGIVLPSLKAEFAAAGLPSCWSSSSSSMLD